MSRARVGNESEHVQVWFRKGGTAVQSSILGTELTNYGRYSVFEDVQILDV